MEGKKEAFRLYLENSGTLAALTKCISKLYDKKLGLPETTQEALDFFKENLSNDFPSQDEFDKLLEQVEESRLKVAAIKKAEEEAKIKADEEAKKKSEEAAKQNDDPSNVETIKDAKMRLNELKNNNDCTSLLIKHLDETMIDMLKDQTTSSGQSLLTCIKPGLIDPNLSVGIYAADADSYDLFAEIFHPIISEYHNFDVDAAIDTAAYTGNWNGDADQFKNLDPTPTHEHIKSTKITSSRSIANKIFYPAMDEQDYLDVLNEVKDCLVNLTGDLEGDFYELDNLDDELMQIITEHHLFELDHQELNTKCWPMGRGVFVNKTKTLIVAVNDEDHLKFISTDEGGEFQKTFDRLKAAIEECSSKLNFEQHYIFGYLTCCPTNLGINTAVIVALPKLTEANIDMENLVNSENLQIRVEKLSNELYEISNEIKLGMPEFEAVIQIQDEVEKLMIVESNLPEK